MTGAQRPHTHDVKAMTTCQIRDFNGDLVEYLVTGGVDTKLSLAVVERFFKLRPKIIYPNPSISPVKGLSKDARLLIIQRNQRVDIYAIRKSEPDTTDSPATKLVGSAKVNSMSNLVSSSISDDGKYLLVCDASTVYLFRLELETNEGAVVRIDPHQVDGIDTLNFPPLTCLKFLKNHRFVATDALGNVHCCSISNLASISHSVLQQPRQHKDEGNNEVPNSGRLWPALPCNSIFVSDDENYIATLSSQTKNAATILKRGGKKVKGMYRHYWTMPPVNGRTSALTFLRSNDKPMVAVANPASEAYVFDIESKKFSSWSKQQGYPLPMVPRELQSKRALHVRMTANPGSSDKLIMGSFGMFCVIDWTQELPEHCRVFPQAHMRRKN